MAWERAESKSREGFRGLLRTPNEVSSVSHWRNVDPQKRGQCTGLEAFGGIGWSGWPLSLSVFGFVAFGSCWYRQSELGSRQDLSALDASETTLGKNQRVIASTSHEEGWRLGVAGASILKADRLFVARSAGEAPDPCPSVGRRRFQGAVETGLGATSMQPGAM